MGPKGFFLQQKKAKKVHYRICLGCSVILKTLTLKLGIKGLKIYRTIRT